MPSRDCGFAVGGGWHGAEYWDRPVRWAGDADSSTLTLWVTNPASDYRLILRAQATADIPNQTVEVIANGESLGILPLESDWAEGEVTLPRLTIAEGGLVALELKHAVRETLGGRNLTAVYESISLEPIE